MTADFVQRGYAYFLMGCYAVFGLMYFIVLPLAKWLIYKMFGRKDR